MSDVCTNSVCAILPMGYILLAVDTYHDLQWCIRPSEKTAHQLRRYYSFILTPKFSPLPWPGFWFPIYVMYVFLYLCPDWIGWTMMALYIPLCRRYYRIEHDENLHGWWSVVIIRVGLAALTYRGLAERGCDDITSYGATVQNFWNIQVGSLAPRFFMTEQ